MLWLWVVLGGVFLLSLLIQSTFLWGICRAGGVRRPADPPQPVTFRRAVGVTFLLFLLGNLFQAGLFFLFRGPIPGSPLVQIAVEGGFFFLLLLVILRGLVCRGVGSSLAVGVVWAVCSFIQVVGTVLLLQATLVEAFIIPTGAMAETILGYHRDVRCPKCGHEFAIHASIDTDPPP